MTTTEHAANAARAFMAAGRGSAEGPAMPLQGMPNMRNYFAVALLIAGNR
jgi:hypothetical protein